VCAACFSSEISKFTDSQSWSDLDRILLIKLNEGKIKKIKLDDGSDSLYTYQCVTCNEHWILQAPVDGKGGSFITLTTILKRLAVPTWRRRLAVVVLVLTIIVVILELLAA
jgi:hypothetical protein